MAQIQGGKLSLPYSEVAESLDEHGAVRLRADGLEEDLVLLRGEDGKLQVLGATCSHLGCQVRPGGAFLVCPCHGSTFDLNGEVVRGPAQKPLNRYPVVLRAGIIDIIATTIQKG
jgi:Rieske Fe-S protein